MKKFDIVIPVGPHDIKTIAKVVKYAKKNVVGYRNIYLLSCEASLEIEGCITIDENIAPFNKIKIQQQFKTDKFKNVSGWYFQQLLKFYAGLIIPNILDDYLVIDADVYFLKSTTFFAGNKALLAFANLEQEPYHAPYFQHMLQLHPKLIRLHEKYSGICHHAMFNREKISQLMFLVENYHGKGLFWQILLQCVDEKIEGTISGMSEYEIYFNYMNIFHFDDCKIRKLQWKNTNYIPNKLLELLIFRKHDYVSQYVRGNKIKKTLAKLRNFVPYRKRIKNFIKSIPLGHGRQRH